MRNLEFRYLVTVFATIATIVGGVLAINLLVDPLWYLNGNVISGVNYQYNERHSKAYLFRKNPEQYDCVILGSSTGSLINEKKIDGYNCFNFSFALGNAREFATYAEYVERQLPDVRLVIVSVDPYTLVDRDLWDRSPDFVTRSDVSPPSILASYLALDTLQFSLRGITGKRETGIFYRSDFTADLHPKRPTYEPELTLNGAFRKEFHHEPTDTFTDRHFGYFWAIRSLFPNAHFVGVAPPITAHYIGFLRLSDNLDALLAVKHQLAGIFDRFYDFSLPSHVTKNPDNTYDGAHFDLRWYEHVVDSINHGDSWLGLNVHEMSLARYREIFFASADAFIAESDIRLD